MGWRDNGYFGVKEPAYISKLEASKIEFMTQLFGESSMDLIILMLCLP